MEQDPEPLHCELSHAEGELLFVLQSVISEWGKEALIVQLPEEWSSRPIELGVETQYATLDTVSLIVDCGDHYIQYHADLNEIWQ